MKAAVGASLDELARKVCGRPAGDVFETLTRDGVVIPDILQVLLALFLKSKEQQYYDAILLFADGDISAAAITLIAMREGLDRLDEEVGLPKDQILNRAKEIACHVFAENNRGSLLDSIHEQGGDVSEILGELS